VVTVAALVLALTFIICVSAGFRAFFVTHQ